jgi:hypothetical protein
LQGKDNNTSISQIVFTNTYRQAALLHFFHDPFIELRDRGTIVREMNILIKECPHSIEHINRNKMKEFLRDTKLLVPVTSERGKVTIPVPNDWSKEKETLSRAMPIRPKPVASLQKLSTTFGRKKYIKREPIYQLVDPEQDSSFVCNFCIL